jgi:hypothetical protein
VIERMNGELDAFGASAHNRSTIIASSEKGLQPLVFTVTPPNQAVEWTWPSSSA